MYHLTVSPFTYPVSREEADALLFKAHGRTKTTGPLSADDLALVSLAVPQVAERPETTAAQVAIRDAAPSIVNGVSVIGWTVRDKTADEIAAERDQLALTRPEFAIAAAAAGLITEAEALAWAGGTALPQFATDAIDGTAGTSAEKLAMKIEALTAANIRRTAPTVLLLGAALNMSDAQMDELFG